MLTCQHHIQWVRQVDGGLHQCILCTQVVTKKDVYPKLEDLPEEFRRRWDAHEATRPQPAEASAGKPASATASTAASASTPSTTPAAASTAAPPPRPSPPPRAGEGVAIAADPRSGG